VLGGSAQWISQQKIRSDNVLTNSRNRATGRGDEFWNQAERELQEAEESRKLRKRNPRRHLENNKKVASSAAFLQ
jgi:hypothetical protein